MSNRKLAVIFQAVFGAAWLSTCPAQAQLVPASPPTPASEVPEITNGSRTARPVPASPPIPSAPAEPGVDDILGQLEKLRQERAAIAEKERSLTELLGRKLAEQGERVQKLGLKTAGSPEATKKPTAVAPPSEPGSLYFPTRVGTRRVYSAFGSKKIDVVTAVRTKVGGTVTVTVADPSQPNSARHIRVSRTALELLSAPDAEGGRDVLRPTAAIGEEWMPWGEGGLVFRQAGTEQVTVPAGTFQALRVDTGHRSGSKFQAESSVWYAPGVGTVRQVNGGTEVLALQSFEPGD